jgi:hypothetical protein
MYVSWVGTCVPPLLNPYSASERELSRPNPLVFLVLLNLLNLLNLKELIMITKAKEPYSPVYKVFGK